MNQSATFAPDLFHLAEEPHHPEGSSTMLGFWLYLMSDWLIFAMLFAAYAVLGSSYAGGPAPKHLFDLPLVALNTSMLLFSSITYGFAMLAMNDGKRAATQAWLAITGLFGLAFHGVEIQRCKAIVTGILMSSGDPRGEEAAATTVRALFDGVIADWSQARDFSAVDYDDRFGEDVPIASDVVLQQAVFNLLDNAAEISAGAIFIVLSRVDDMVVLTVSDQGPRFADEQLANVGKPYNSSKSELGRDWDCS